MTKNTLLPIAIKFNVKYVKIFYFYRLRKISQSKIGYFTYNSVRKLKYKINVPIRRRTKLRGLIVTSRQWTIRADLTSRRAYFNKVLLLRKNFNPIGVRVTSGSLLDIKRRKYLTHFLLIY